MRKSPLFGAVLLIVLCLSFAAKVEARRGRKRIIVAHRGASAYLPEHTLEAKALAYGMNPDYIEQDVALTKDAVPIVIHDHYLDTVTNVAKLYPKRKRKDGRYYAIDFKLSEIKRLRAFERIDLKTGKAVYPQRFPLKHKLPFRIPTLEEEIQLIQGLNASTGNNVGMYVELKAPWFHRKEGKNIAKAVMKVLRKYGYDKPSAKIYVQCFDPKCLRYLRYFLGVKLKLVQLVANNDWNETPGVDYDKMLTATGIKKVARYADGLGPWIPQLFSKNKKGKIKITKVVKRAHAEGLEVHPYTARADSLPKNVKSQTELFRILFHRIGVDGVFTDFPDKGVNFLKYNRRRRR